MLNLLVETAADGTMLWNKVKHEPGKPSVRTLQRFIEHVDWLTSLAKDIGDLPSIPEEKRLQFFYEAKAYSSDKMKALKYNKRVALIALLVREQHLHATDSLVDLFIKKIRKLHNNSQID